MVDNNIGVGKEIKPISEIDFYKSAVSLFESALRAISITHGGHKCNKIANKALSIYYGGRDAMVKRGKPTTEETHDTSDSEQKPANEVQLNPYANGAFMGIGS